MNFGERIANRQLQKVGRKLRASYRTAQKELEETLADFNKRFKEKDRQKRALKAAGKISEQEYKNWLSGQVFIRGQWEKKLKSVCRVLHEYNVQAGKMIHEGKIDVFAENYNYSAFVAEQKTGISFDIYNTEAVTRLIKDEPQVLPEWKVDEEKDYKWNRKKVQNAVTQGIIQGDSIEDITARLCRDLVTTNENKMRLFARTAMTGAQNAGRQKHMEQAAKKGIRQNKRWVATLDSRTRDAHRELDGQEVPYDKPFKIDGEEIMFPGDPSAPPALSYNCRCRHVTIYPDYEDYSKRDWREDEIIDGQTYEEWKKGKRVREEVVSEEGFDGIKKKVLDHHGEWRTTELQEIGSDVAKEVDKRIKANPPKIEYDKEISKLDDELSDLYQQYEKQKKIANRTYSSEDWKKANKIAEEYTGKYNKRQQLINESSEYYSGIMRDTLADIRSLGGVTKENRRTYMNAKTGKAVEALTTSMNYYPSSWLEHSAQSNIGLNPKWTTGRAYYQPGFGTIMINDQLGTGIHELAHRFERCVPGLRDAERSFYIQRTEGEELKHLGKGYNSYEKTRRDDFINPYMGKDYGGTAYELASMGFEYAFTRYDKLSIDQGMRNWVLGLLSCL